MADQSNFRNIYDRFWLPLSMYALRITGDSDLARDVVQESMTSLWEKLSEGMEIANPKGYLYRVCHNKALNAMRRGFPERESLAPDDEAVEIPEEEIDTSERDARLWEAIGRLPEKTRRVFLLNKRDGLTAREISEELGVSVKTVENQIATALSRLRSSLRGRNDRAVFFLPFL